MRLAPSCGVLLCGVFAVSTAIASDVSPLAEPVTVLLDSEHSLSPASLHALEAELASILSDSHIRVSLKMRADVPDHQQFRDLVLFRMRGRCTMDALPVGALSDERGPLALTHISNGEFLPFGEVECDRVRESVRRAVGRANPAAHEPDLGVALARVMAHEMYHMIAHSGVHTHSGVTKAALSARELTGPRLALDERSRNAVSHRADP